MSILASIVCRVLSLFHGFQVEECKVSHNDRGPFGRRRKSKAVKKRQTTTVPTNLTAMHSGGVNHDMSCV